MFRTIFKKIGRGRKLAKFLYSLYLSKDKTILDKVERCPYIFLENDFALYFYLHDRDLFEVISKHVVRGDYVLDIGAHQGYFSAVFASFIGKEGRVFSVEAMPETYNVLKRNSEFANNDDYKISPYQFAVSDKEGILDFWTQELSPVNSLFSSWPSDPNLNLPRKRISVTSTTLDKFILSHNINKINCIKIDVEGAEWAVLQGSAHILKTMSPRLVAVESSDQGLSFYEKTVYDLINFMEQFDYELTDVNLTPIRNTNLGSQANYYFFHKSYLNSL